MGVSVRVDGQLLEQFASRHDASAEAAFAALVARHGPMVLSVCRDQVRDRHLAEDAFQAVFLVLARKARFIRDSELLGNWLYGVAVRTSRQASAQQARRHGSEDTGRDCLASSSTLSSLPIVTDEPVEAAMQRSEDAAILHDELARPPHRFRAPILLFYFEGLTHDEAARRLGCPVGTVRSRLARARERLRGRLIRRNVTLSAGALAATLTTRKASTGITPRVCERISHAAARFASSNGTGTKLPAAATALAQEVLREVSLCVLKHAVPVLLIVGTVLAAAGMLSLPLTRGEPLNLREAAVPLARPSAVIQPPVPQPDPGRTMVFTGRVLDPQDRPLPDAAVAVVARTLSPGRVGDLGSNGPKWIGKTHTDGAGQFRISIPRTSTGETDQLGLTAGAMVGYGTTWITIDPDDVQPVVVVLPLRAEQVFHNRLLDPAGKPAQGARLWVRRIEPLSKGEYGSPNFWGSAQEPEGAYWPAPVTTDQEGRFTIHGVGPELGVILSVEDSRCARQSFIVQTNPTENSKEPSLTLKAARIINGVVTYADSGMPVPHAVISIMAGEGLDSSFSGSKHQADAQGRFRILSLGNYFHVTAFAPSGEPYLVVTRELDWPKGSAEQNVELGLRRGVLLHGKVTAAGTDKPVAGASVVYQPRQVKGQPEDMLSGWQANVLSDRDGSFRIAVLPGAGHLLVFGPTSDYVLQGIGERELASGQSGGERSYAHAIVGYDVQAEAQPVEMSVELKRGVTVTGRVMDPGGQPVDDAEIEIITLLSVDPLQLAWRGVYTIPVRAGKFALHGLDPENRVRLDFHDAVHGWGKHLELSGNQAGKEPLTVRLEPCGKARARFVGPDQSPDVNRFPHLEILATSGPSGDSRVEADVQQLAADAAYIPNVDRVHYDHGPFTDADGQITLPCLIPGAYYRLSDSSTMGTDKGAQVRKDFAVKPGETHELGDILIEKPRR